MAETFYAGDKIRKYYGKDDLSEAEKEEHYQKVIDKFGWVTTKDFIAISTPVLHPILEEEFVSGLLPVGQKNILFGISIQSAARKFSMDTKTSYIRAYKIFLESEMPILPWLPSNSNLIAVGENHAEFGRACPTGIETFKDYYFSGDSDLIEAQFGLARRRGQYETYYGATCIGNEVIEIKQYCYDSQQLLSDWDVYAIVARREREVGAYGDAELTRDYEAAIQELVVRSTASTI